MSFFGCQSSLFSPTNASEQCSRALFHLNAFGNTSPSARTPLASLRSPFPNTHSALSSLLWRLAPHTGASPTLLLLVHPLLAKYHPVTRLVIPPPAPRSPHPCEASRRRFIARTAIYRPSCVASHFISVFPLWDRCSVLSAPPIHRPREPPHAPNSHAVAPISLLFCQIA